MSEALEILWTASFWVAAVRIATPLIFATMGELICERAGVLNLGIEGIMTAGAFVGWITVFAGADLWVGVLAAALVGAMFGALHGFMTVPLGLSQHVTGIGITLLATSLTYFTYRVALPEVTWLGLYLPDHLPLKRVGPANQVPLSRLALTAMLGGLLGESSPAIAWVAAAIAASILLLDGVDGWLARRGGWTSAFGARFDMETDALLILFMAALCWQLDKAGAWILLSGTLR